MSYLALLPREKPINALDLRRIQRAWARMNSRKTFISRVYQDSVAVRTGDSILRVFIDSASATVDGMRRGVVDEPANSTWPAARGLGRGRSLRAPHCAPPIGKSPIVCDKARLSLARAVSQIFDGCFLDVLRRTLRDCSGSTLTYAAAVG